jgi:hypothetical protein
MIKNIMKLLKSATLSLLLAGSFFTPDICNGQSKEIVYRDTHRDIPGYIDFGAYQTYKISPEEISKLEPKKLREITEIYVRRYYDYYMYFSRNIIVKQCAENYPPDLLEPVVKSVVSLSDLELKKLVTEFYNSDGGVTRENQHINSLLVPIMQKWEMKKFGAIKSLNGPAFHSPNAIYLAFLKKIGLRANNYAPPFYPKGMDPSEEKVISKIDKKSDSLLSNKLLSYGVVFLIGFFLGALIIKMKNINK